MSDATGDMEAPSSDAPTISFKKRGKRNRENMKTTSSLAQQNQSSGPEPEKEKSVVVQDVTEQPDEEQDQEEIAASIPTPSPDDDEREELTGSLAELKKKLNKKRKVNEDLVSSTKSKTSVHDHSMKSSRSAAPDTKNYASNVTVTIEPRDTTKLKEGQPKWAGPLRQANNVRAISRFDYQPDICKDYKETGYCGYGDNCKFMHDRGDYKSGWQLEKEWDEKQEAKKRALLSGVTDEEENYEIKEDTDLPWACLICREPFVNPVVTRCGHYFCESCALSHYQRDTKCQACQQQTNGIFNTANNIIADQKRRKAEAASEADDPTVELEPSRPQQQEGWAIP